MIMTDIKQEIERAHAEGYTQGRIDEVKTCAGCSDKARQEGYRQGVLEESVGCYDHCEIARKEERKEIVNMMEGMKRTDETQMSHDHIYDEALGDVITKIKERV